MNFEEFFKKKRIDLAALGAAEPGLFAEFEKHFALMGEKSFDHTKKYWFNKLRLQYHLAPEQKPEKIHQENQIAEQTIVETLTESIPAPATGFKPRFKPGMAGKSPANTSDVKDVALKDSATATPEVNEAAANHDQNPPFEQEKAAMQQIADSTPRTTDGEGDEQQIEASVKKPSGFKPRFNLKMTQGTAPQTKEFKDEQESEGKTGPDAGVTEENKAPKPAGFKPRFNAKAMAAKPAEEVAPVEENRDQPATETSSANEQKQTSDETPDVPKIGFKPRFNAKTTKPQPPQE